MTEFLLPLLELAISNFLSSLMSFYTWGQVNLISSFENAGVLFLGLVLTSTNLFYFEKAFAAT